MRHLAGWAVLLIMVFSAFYVLKKMGLQDTFREGKRALATDVIYVVTGCMTAFSGLVSLWKRLF